jgi:predicted dehydrogenase
MKKRTAPLRIGAIGCGDLACGYHHPGIVNTPELKLAALCDLDAARLAAEAKRYDVKQTYTDFREMLDRCELDGVCIVGPPSLHVEAGRECLIRQIPFITEKPMCATLEEAKALADLAKKHGDCGMTAYTSRWSPAQRLARKISQKPEFGKIAYVATCHRTTALLCPIWGRENPVEGMVYLHGCHAVDLWRFFGGNPTEVSVSVTGITPTDIKDFFNGSILVSVRTQDGPHGVIHIKAGSPHNADLSSDVMGEMSRVTVSDNQELYYEKKQDSMNQLLASDGCAGMIDPDQPTGEFVLAGMMSSKYYPDYFRFEWMTFARCLLEGKPLPWGIEDAYHTACLLEAICVSVRDKGRWTSVRNTSTIDGINQ